MSEASDLPAVLWPTATQELVLEVAIGPQARVAAAFAAWTAGLDLSGYFDMPTFRLLPLVYRRLHALGMNDPRIALLRGVHRKAWCEQQALTYAMGPLMRALHAAGIQTMLIKGAALQQCYYGADAIRPMSDLDIVVRPGQTKAAREVLAGLGWVANETARDEDLRYRHSMMFRDGHGHEMDLHWHLMREACCDAASAEFWAHSVPFEYAGVATCRPGHADMLLHTVIHGMRANRAPPLRWIADAVTILRVAGADFDWNRLLERAAALRLTARLHLGLAYIARRFAAGVPAEVLATLARRRPSWVERVENSVVLRDTDRLYTSALTKPWVMFAEYARVAPDGGPARFVNGFTHYMRYRSGARGRRELAGQTLLGLSRRVGRVLSLR